MIYQSKYKYIQTIAECKSFSKAAKLLYVSQPSLSRFVKKVEDEIGMPLFYREKNPLELTAAGKLYIQFIEEFQALDNKMREAFICINSTVISKLSIGTLPFLGTYVLPKIIPNFANIHSSVDVKIQEYSSRSLLNALETEEIDLCLTNIPASSKKLCCISLCPDNVVLIAPCSLDIMRNYNLSDNSFENPLLLNISELKELPFIVLHPWQNMRLVADKIFKNLNFIPKKQIEVPSLASAISLVGSNKGVTFVCNSSLHCLQPETPLAYISVGAMANYTAINAVYRNDDNRAIIKNFCDCATKALQHFT